MVPANEGTQKTNESAMTTSFQSEGVSDWNSKDECRSDRGP